MIFFAADGAVDTTTPDILDATDGTGLDVPVVEPAPENDITEINIDEGPIGPEELIGESPEQASAQLDEAMGEKRERGPDGKFLPKKTDGEQKPAVQAKPVKPLAAPKPKVETPKPVEVTPPVAKIKIGEEEKTAEEWAVHYRELKEKAEAAAKPPEPLKDTAAEEQAQQEAATAQRAAFLETRAKAFEPKEEDLDVILSGGKPAVEKLGQLLAETAAKEREDFIPMVANALKDIEDRIAPILEREKTIAKHVEETTAIESNPALKAHPEGLATYRAVRDEYQKAFTDIQAKGEAATPQEKAWALDYSSRSPEELRSNFVQQAAAKLPAPVAQSSPATNGNAKAVTPPKPRVTTPLNSDRPGGGSPTPKVKTADGAMIDELVADGKWERGT